MKDFAFWNVDMAPTDTITVPTDTGTSPGDVARPVALPDPPESWLELTPAPATALADRRWAYDQYSAGAFDQFRGEFVAIHEQRILGHGERKNELRERVSRETGLSAARLFLLYIDRQFATHSGAASRGTDQPDAA